MYQNIAWNSDQYLIENKVHIRGFQIFEKSIAIARRDLFTVFWVPEVGSKSRGR